ncbi:MAG: class I SAM-dependent methyltransferase [Gammaproteobacteria bacterium]|nr:class I SAM-dependent methyltransferase [Gammaproteobacteria bacterium]
MSKTENQPDWDKIAEKFDLWLPQLAPVGEAILEKLGAKSGDRIIDLGSGTGEPALSLARKMTGQVTITGIDSADGMVNVAQQKVIDEKLQGIEFRTMSAEQIRFEDNQFDRALCRFGVMLFDDPLKGLKEMRRVLKPNGYFSLAVWGAAETMLTLYWTYEAFKNRIDEDLYPPLAKVTSLGAPHTMETLLKKAGFHEFTIEPITFHYKFKSFDAYWDTVEASDILKMQYDALPDEQKPEIRNEVSRFARNFIKDGTLTIPHEYLLVSGKK